MNYLQFISLKTQPKLFNRILSKFPLEDLTYCFAYGSGVFDQLHNRSNKNMIDFIFAVKNSEKWHSSNLQLNPSHYSALSFLGSKFIAKVQTSIPSRVYYNSMIPLKDEKVVIKYGVIEENDLISDLLDWNDIYIAGRLHKPVKVIQKNDSMHLVSALQLNLQSAVHTALLLLPETFSEIQFYSTIASLSYNGDFRMKLEKTKISNFKNLYSPVIKVVEDYVEMPHANGLQPSAEKSCSQDISPSAKHFHLNHLPKTPQKKIVEFWNKGVRNCQDTEDVLRAMAYDEECKEVVNLILNNIVWNSSVQQSLKGIITAGFWKSLKYSSIKIGKMINAKNSH
ncbi:conserved hypothetical protein [Pediculus humanus corporis]|uniref:Phosphatidate cytidylyltransferase, mitochondrial n=1 Tax=Pediculus humanus subsp. corporis TaxID=121224 RepID=E0VMJ8_PEDHC|nr:uncharacterized protein Phum_PHUM311000 [Pediculus humanus corporis]EEB14604.1 conserved hypothetical protein [Pediculus humanus corporis]